MANHTTSTLSLMSSATEARVGYMYITPNEGYVVSASDFDITDSVSELETEKADTATAGTIGNKVKITVTLTNFAATTDEVIDLTISDSAVLYIETVDVPISLTIPSELDSNTDGVSVDIVNGTLANGLTETSGVITGDITTDTDNINDLIYIADVITTVDAENSSGTDIDTYITDVGTLVVGESPYVFELNDILTETDTSKQGYGSVISYTESIYLDIRQNQQEYLAPSGSGEYTLKSRAQFKESVSVTTKYVDSVEVGSTLINNKGETKTIKVYGDAGAAFTINWDPSDGSSVEYSGSIPSSEKFNTGKGSYVLNIDVPSASTNKSYDLWLVAGASTSLKSNVPSATAKTTLNQYINPTLTMTTSTTDTGRTWSLPADITYTGRPLVAGTDIDYLRGVDSVFDITYTMTNTTSNMNKVDEPVEADWSVSPNDGTKTVLLFTNMSTTVDGSTSGTVKATVHIVNWGSANTTYTLNLDNLIQEPDS